ncbi:uncharacterized protein [Choristoneura fumiferana]|uniref:uncharacterized protein n=1 Tax=Choristoneura fumiferana TaxID=7141 RepID=UPI003D15D71D
MEFEEVTSKSQNSQSVWSRFKRNKEKTQAQCKVCSKVLKCVGGSTTGLLKHLKAIHKKFFDKEDNSATSATTEDVSGEVSRPSEITYAPADEMATKKKKAKLTDFYSSTSKPSLGVTVSRMVSLDGIPFSTFTQSEDLKRLFQKEDHILPKSPNSIREIVLKEKENVMKELISKIKKILSDGGKFSISYDEWTSNHNRRYISINLHSKQLHDTCRFKNLGLIRIHGSMSAEKCIEELNKRLQCYEINLYKDVVASITDGCSMMKKTGRLLPTFHQQCIAHAVQLAVVDIFYKRSPIALDSCSEQEEDTDEDMPLVQLVRLQNERRVTIPNEDDTSDEEDGGVEFTREIIESQARPTEFRYHDILSKIRKTIKIFKKSPKKNEEYLQKYVLSEFGMEYELILDVQTRWSSVANMVSRFLMLRNCITKALLDLRICFEFSQEEWRLLSELHGVLETVKITTEALCQRDASILTADVAMKFAIKKLQNTDSSLSKEMCAALKKRYKERRLLEASVMQYLANADTYFANLLTDDFELFPRPSSNQMCEMIVALLRRTSDFQQREPDQDGYHETQTVRTLSQSTSIQDNQMSNKEELNLEIQKALAAPNQSASNTVDENLSSLVKVEMALWENGGQRGYYLTIAHQHLGTIPPTSVEPERIFSSAGYICNRLRTRLSDESLDAISVLRTHYQQLRMAR